MKINLDGSLDILEGEILPFTCPKCLWFIEYDEKVLMVNCFHCGYIGSKDEFDNEYGAPDSPSPI